MGRKKNVNVESEGEVVDVEFKRAATGYERAEAINTEAEDNRIEATYTEQPAVETSSTPEIMPQLSEPIEPKLAEPEEPKTIQVAKNTTVQWQADFETIKGMDMFMPEKSERDGYYLKLRAAKGMDGIVYPSHTYQRDDDVLIFTGVRYNSVFKSPHFVKELPELCHKYGIFMGSNTMDLDGELVLHMYIRVDKIRLNQGMPIAELVVVNANV